MIQFNQRIVIIGCGSVAQCVLPILFKHIDIKPGNLTIIDSLDNRSKIEPYLANGVRYLQHLLTPENLSHTLDKYLAPGDILIDLGYNISTDELVQFCHQKNVLFVNTSVEEWDPYKDAYTKDVRELTLYHRHMRLRKVIGSWDAKGPTAILDHGANPGLISHFLKAGLIDIGANLLKLPMDRERKGLLERALGDRNFAEIAYLAGVKTIHISERDTQITDKPKEVNEFVNTWSVEGLLEEGQAPAEMGWGTHEKYTPVGAFIHKDGPRNQICLAEKGMKVWARSWVPSGEITGMVIRHGEAFSISEALTCYAGNNPIYRPTVHYAYCPSDGTISSLLELEMRHYNPQPKHRILNDEIIGGHDELGCLIMGHDLNAWWTGSILDIEEARKLAPHQNATTVQVAIGVVSALIYMIRQPGLGVCLPDQLDHEEILKIAKPYLGEFVSCHVDWDPLKHIEQYLSYQQKVPDEEDRWQFSTFAVNCLPKEVPALVTAVIDR